jgi:hypothetical protein
MPPSAAKGPAVPAGKGLFKEERGERLLLIEKYQE